MTIVQKLAAWAAGLSYADLPPEVAQESKRILLDSIGCALAATEDFKGEIGLKMGRHLGGGLSEATILGTGERSSVWGAAFANGELINSLDMDSVLPPGHVSPYVIPVVMAIAEREGASGEDLVLGVAIAHEISYRIGKAMDYLRDIKDGELVTPKVLGYAATIFGAVAGAGRIMKLDAERLANALGVAGSVSPVNSHMAWVMHAPPTTIKYTHAGTMTNAALTALFCGVEGHRGDLQMLDDPEFGYPRLVNSTRWAKEKITESLADKWGFVAESSIKPYPHCRVMHALFDAQNELMNREGIKVKEIDRIVAWVEGICDKPLWVNTVIANTTDAQFSMRHGLSVAAHGVPVGKDWLTPETVYDPSILALVEKIDCVIHPDYVKLLVEHGASRPAKIEIHARGQVFTNERRYPKGSPSPDPESYMTDAQLEAKFLHNAKGILSDAQASASAKTFMSLETVAHVGEEIRKIASGVSPTATSHAAE